MRRLAQEGGVVLGYDLRVDAVKEMAATLVKEGYRTVAMSCDITKEDDVVAAYDLAVAEFGGIDIGCHAGGC